MTCHILWLSEGDNIRCDGCGIVLSKDDRDAICYQVLKRPPDIKDEADDSDGWAVSAAEFVALDEAYHTLAFLKGEPDGS